MAKLEAAFCSVIKHSLIDGYKIEDNRMYGSGSNSGIRPFDGLGLLNVDGQLKFLCWEAKYMDSPMALNLTNRLEEHQDMYLRSYRRGGVLAYVIVGVNYGRGDKRVFVFDWDEDFGKMYKEGLSIHRKLLDTLPYNKVSKEKFTFDNVITSTQMREYLGKNPSNQTEGQKQ